MKNSPDQNEQETLISVRGLSKRYGGVVAVDQLDLDIRSGEITAIIGENGAGKSTLMKILAGAVDPDEGDHQIRGHPARFRNVRDANDQGVAIVFQELSLFPELDVLANLYLPCLPHTRLQLFNRRTAERQAATVLAQIGLDVDPSSLVGNLTLGEQQLVEIGRGLLTAADVLILDEPNSALNAVETDRLLGVVGRLRDEGRAIIYISHRLEEVMSVADRIVVMRNGSIVRDANPADVSLTSLVADMVGRELANQSAKPGRDLRERPIAIRLSELQKGSQLTDASFDVRVGEVIGLAGLAGAGQGEVLDVLFGRVRSTSGEVSFIDGRGAPHSIVEAVRRGIAYVPSDRRGEGLFLDQTIARNISQVRALSQGRLGFLIRSNEVRRRAEARRDELDIKLRDVGDPVDSLSGGNQQKVVLAKWLEADPSIILLDDPTRGVDVGAKAEIYELVNQLASGGITILFQSSELQEYEVVCDRVVVFYQGRQRLILEGQGISEHNLLESINTGALAA